MALCRTSRSWFVSLQVQEFLFETWAVLRKMTHHETSALRSCVVMKAGTLPGSAAQSTMTAMMLELFNPFPCLFHLSLSPQQMLGFTGSRASPRSVLPASSTPPCPPPPRSLTLCPVAMPQRLVSAAGQTPRMAGPPPDIRPGSSLPRSSVLCGEVLYWHGNFRHSAFSQAFYYGCTFPVTQLWPIYLIWSSLCEELFWFIAYLMMKWFIFINCM